MIIRSTDLGDDLADRATQMRAAQAARAIAVFSGSMTLEQYASALDEAAGNASANVEEARDIHAVTAKDQAEIEDIARQLAALAESAHAAASRNPDGTITPRTALALVKRHQAWLSRVLGVGLDVRADALDTAQQILDAPGALVRGVASAASNAVSSIAGGAAKGLGSGFGIPTWAIWVAALGLGAYVARPYVQPLLKRL